MAASKRHRNEEKQDALGFTLSDYFDMQRLKDKEGIAVDGVGSFDITAEQVRLINGNDCILRKIAADCFYFANLRVLRKIAFSFLKHNARLLVVVSLEDLLQQVYVDLCDGYIKLSTDAKRTRYALYDCFKLAAIGGLGVLANDT